MSLCRTCNGKVTILYLVCHFFKFLLHRWAVKNILKLTLFMATLFFFFLFRTRQCRHAVRKNYEFDVIHGNLLKSVNIYCRCCKIKMRWAQGFDFQRLASKQ